MIEDLLIDFDEMGFAPTTLCENPKYAVEWKKRLVAEIDKLRRLANPSGFICRARKAQKMYKTAWEKEV